jgi:hypothetical protein
MTRAISSAERPRRQLPTASYRSGASHGGVSRTPEEDRARVCAQDSGSESRRSHGDGQQRFGPRSGHPR